MTLAEQTTSTGSASGTPMRKVISLMHVSLDGFAAGPNGELEWGHIDEEIYAYVADLLRTADTALYGRTTYQMMESYWPTVPADPSSTQAERQHAHWVENVQKIVFSKTLERVTWNNTRLVKENIAEEISRLKHLPGKDMMIFGSPGLTHTFIQLGLIDEYRLTINPVVLGKGVPLFKDIKEQIALELLASKTFRSGVVGLHYRKGDGGSAS
jgi:dihydrofolate reductase